MINRFMCITNHDLVDKNVMMRHELLNDIWPPTKSELLSENWVVFIIIKMLLTVVGTLYPSTYSRAIMAPTYSPYPHNLCAWLKHFLKYLTLNKFNAYPGGYNHHVKYCGQSEFPKDWLCMGGVSQWNNICSCFMVCDPVCYYDWHF